MERKLRRIQGRLIWIIGGSFALIPVISYSIAVFHGIVDPQFLLRQPIVPMELFLYSALLVWVVIHFRHLFNPVFEWIDTHEAHNTLPENLSRNIFSFSANYWSFILLYTIIFPTVHHWFAVIPEDVSAYSNLLQLTLLQLVVFVLFGMPGYLLSLTILDRLTPYTGLNTVQVSMKTKMLLAGGYIPLLAFAALLNYYVEYTDFVQTELLLMWGLLALITFAITLLTTYNLSQSLRPVYQIFENSGASSHADLITQLRPKSTDEIGYMLQTVAHLFERLGEQESHVHAVIDHAAEGIIVTDSAGLIVLFNPAAEKLFGFTSHEIRGHPFSWLFPEIVSDTGVPHLADGEKEVHGLQRNGSSIPVSVRISQMQMGHKVFYTCLVADISRHKAAELKLLDAEARYRNLVETAHDLVWSMDKDGYWTYLNNASTLIYGHTPDEMIGRHFFDLQAPESVERDNEALLRLLDGKELLHYETVHLDKNDKAHHINFNAKPLFDNDGNLLYITGTASDITEQKVFERELTYQAQHDTLTGLHNRQYFHQELNQVIARVVRSAVDCALFYLDIDQFKYINDTLGHASGDRLLLECTNLLSTHIREGDLLARFGGDEFTILLYNVSTDQAMSVAENIRSLFETSKFFEEGKFFNITCSIGITIINSEIETADDALSQADLACNIAKTQGRNYVHLFNPKENKKIDMAEDMGWALRVRDSCENNRFKLMYQPIISLATGRVYAYEVLLRMTVENGDLILPGGFMPAAERFGLIHNVDRWTVKNAICHLATLHDAGFHARFAINLSGRAFDDRELLPLINGLLRDTGLEPDLVTFEITETAAIANLNAAIKFIGSLKDIGCQFALDDFGSGFCSFAYLKHLPVDKLKIDGAFVQGLANDSVDQAMVQSMNQIAHALGKQTIAEFVEDECTLKLLKSYKVDFAQGYFLGKPQTIIYEELLNDGDLDESQLVAGNDQVLLN